LNKTLQFFLILVSMHFWSKMLNVLNTLFEVKFEKIQTKIINPKVSIEWKLIRSQ